VQEAANPEANIIFGATWDENFQDEMRVTVIATGFDHKEEEQEEKKPSFFGDIVSSTDSGNGDGDIWKLFQQK
jgi:cell division protein FtsZ